MTAIEIPQVYGKGQTPSPQPQRGDRSVTSRVHNPNYSGYCYLLTYSSAALSGCGISIALPIRSVDPSGAWRVDIIPYKLHINLENEPLRKRAGSTTPSFLPHRQSPLGHTSFRSAQDTPPR